MQEDTSNDVVPRIEFVQEMAGGSGLWAVYWGDDAEPTSVHGSKRAADIWVAGMLEERRSSSAGRARPS